MTHVYSNHHLLETSPLSRLSSFTHCCICEIFALISGHYNEKRLPSKTILSSDTQPIFLAQYVLSSYFRKHVSTLNRHTLIHSQIHPHSSKKIDFIKAVYRKVQNKCTLFLIFLARCFLLPYQVNFQLIAD